MPSVQTHESKGGIDLNEVREAAHTLNQWAARHGEDAVDHLATATAMAVKSLEATSRGDEATALLYAALIGSNLGFIEQDALAHLFWGRLQDVKAELAIVGSLLLRGKHAEIGRYVEHIAVTLKYIEIPAVLQVQ